MSLSKKQREDIIRKWLEGEDNPEYDVKPLKEEGRYRVFRKENLELSDSSVENEENKSEDKSSNVDITPLSGENKQEKEIPETKKQIKKSLPVLRPIPDENCFATQSRKPANQSRNVASRGVQKALSLIPSLYENQLETNQRILEHLKLLGEDNEKKRQRKELKKQVKNQIRKEKTGPATSSLTQEDKEGERTIIIQQPVYQRRRIDPNL
jgi:hypothetical protein